MKLCRKVSFPGLHQFLMYIYSTFSKITSEKAGYSMHQQMEDTNKCTAEPNCSSTTVETRIAIRRIVWYTPLGTFLLAVAIAIGLGVSLKAWNVSPSNDIHTDTGIIVSTSTGILSKREEEYSLQRELEIGRAHV